MKADTAIPNMYQLSDSAVNALLELYQFAVDDTAYGYKVVQYALNNTRYTSVTIAQIQYDCIWRAFNGVVLGNHIVQLSRTDIATQCKNPGFADDTLLQFIMQEWRSATLYSQVLFQVISAKLDKYYGN